MDTVPVSKEEVTEQATPTFREAFMFWLKIGGISFGAPASQIAEMERLVYSGTCSVFNTLHT